jgi:hypothetical protein
MPSFVAYTLKYAVTILVPVLVVVWVFFKFVF